MEQALEGEDCFEKYSCKLDEMKNQALTEQDRQSIKYNYRKQDLFEQALYFS